MFPFQIGPNHVGYNLDRCEEIVLVDAWLKVRARIGVTEIWTKEFEDRFFKTDNGVSERWIENIERHLRRCKFEGMNLRKTALTPYMRSRHQERIESRREIVEQMREPAARAGLVKSALEAMAAMPPFIELHEDQEDPSHVANKRREDALERVRQEQAARDAVQARKDQEARDLEIQKARKLVAAVSDEVARHRPGGGRLFGALEDLLLGLSAKVELLSARSRLEDLERAELMRKFEALEKRLAEEAAQRSRQVFTFSTGRIAASERISEEHHANGHANGDGERPFNGRHEHHVNGDRRRWGRAGNGRGGNGHGDGYDHETNGNRHHNGEGDDEDGMIFSTPGGWYGSEGR